MMMIQAINIWFSKQNTRHKKTFFLFAKLLQVVHFLMQPNVQIMKLN